MANIRIGTRGSKLAMWQAEWVAGQLAQHGHSVEIKVVSTQGDVSTASLSTVGGQGVFTKEIQRELLLGHVDLAVHSLKDLPTQPIEGLTLGAIPERESTKDCLISREGQGFLELPAEARVGTGSTRRGAQLLAWRPDVQIADIRGNVDSRLRKLEEGKYDAIVLAAAGLQRLKLTEHISETLPQDKMLPAVGQGALGLECRSEDTETLSAVAGLNHLATQAAVTAERALLASLLAGCLAPVAAIGDFESSSRLKLVARVCSTDGATIIEAGQTTECQSDQRCDLSSAAQLGQSLAEELKTLGALRLISSARR